MNVEKLKLGLMKLKLMIEEDLVWLENEARRLRSLK